MNETTTPLEAAPLSEPKTLQITLPEPEEGAFHLLFLAHQELVNSAERFATAKFKTKAAANDVSEKTMAALMCFDAYLPHLLKERDAQATENAMLRQERDDLKEVLDDKRRLTRELDVALSGEGGAAKQASLCDLVQPVRRLRERAEVAEGGELEALREKDAALEELATLRAKVVELEEAARWRDASIELPEKSPSSDDSPLLLVETQWPYHVTTAWYEYDTRKWVSSEMGVDINVVKWRYANG